MSKNHYLVFVGATAALSDELRVIGNGNASIEIVAPACPKNAAMICDQSILLATKELMKAVAKRPNQNETVRLTVWAYHPNDPPKLRALWSVFGRAGWVELVPSALYHKIVPTRLYVEERLQQVVAALHDVAHLVYAKRKRSCLPLPLRNFHSKILEPIREFWYFDKKQNEIGVFLNKTSVNFKQRHGHGSGHIDERSLVFKPAEDNERHGLAHPTGEGQSYMEGRFRFGAALFPGFHYDVNSVSGNLDCLLFDHNGQTRDMKPEKRAYLNIFPNDYLLPKRSA